MKNLILVTLLTILTSSVFATDLYVDAYRFSDVNHTGKLGMSTGDYNVEYSFDDGTFAIGERKYMSFTNIEFGVQLMITNKVNPEAIDHRVIDVEGGLHATVNPYFKAGSDLFLMVKLDESNEFVLQVGFNLF